MRTQTSRASAIAQRFSALAQSRSIRKGGIFPLIEVEQNFGAQPVPLNAEHHNESYVKLTAPLSQTGFSRLAVGKRIRQNMIRYSIRPMARRSLL
jgi:hypothetical protein